MTKTYCDICKIHIKKRDDEVRIGANGFLMNVICCKTCFLDKTNWEIIQRKAQKNPYSHEF